MHNNKKEPESPRNKDERLDERAFSVRDHYDISKLYLASAGHDHKWSPISAKCQRIKNHKRQILKNRADQLAIKLMIIKRGHSDLNAGIKRPDDLCFIREACGPLDPAPR